MDQHNDKLWEQIITSCVDQDLQANENELLQDQLEKTPE